LRNWLPIASKVSVHNCPVRTNNLVESFHHIANQKIGMIHPNLWIFLSTCTFIYIFMYIKMYIM